MDFLCLKKSYSWAAADSEALKRVWSQKSFAVSTYQLFSVFFFSSSSSSLPPLFFLLSVHRFLLKHFHTAAAAAVAADTYKWKLPVRRAPVHGKTFLIISHRVYNKKEIENDGSGGVEGRGVGEKNQKELYHEVKIKLQPEKKRQEGREKKRTAITKIISVYETVPRVVLWLYTFILASSCTYTYAAPEVGRCGKKCIGILSWYIYTQSFVVPTFFFFCNFLSGKLKNIF